MKLKAINLPADASGAVSSTAYLALEFVRRLKSYAAYYQASLAGSGYRSVYDQASAYLRYKTGQGNPAAYPGESWHNCGLAFDVAKNSEGKYPATMPEDFKHPPTEQGLNVFGLCLPMWSGSADKEPWHVTPIECLGIAGGDRQWFLDRDDRLNSASGYRTLLNIKLPENPAFTRSALMRGNDVKLMQELLKTGADGSFGPLTEKAVTDYQTRVGLSADGICGSETWEKLLTPDYKVLYEQAMAAQGEWKRSIIAKIDAIDDMLFSIRGDLT